MKGAIRVKLVGEDPELDAIAGMLAQAKSSFHRFPDIDEACESQEDDAADLFVLGPSAYSQANVNLVQKLPARPGVMLATGAKLPNLAKILMPPLLDCRWSSEELQWELQAAVDSQRRNRRLEALRDHQKRGRNLEANPAIHLLTNLMKKCTMADEYRDLLSAVLSLRSVVDFHDASLLVLDSTGHAIECWHSAKEAKERLKEIALESMVSPDDFPEGEVVPLSSSAAPSVMGEVTDHPWSFGLAMRFSLGQAMKGVKAGRSAILVLYRRELVPFLERDYWLLEMTYGPLALALEKVAMLNAIGLASKEWRSTFDGISEPLTVIDSSYLIVKANRSFARLVDQDIKKLKGRRCYALLANRRSPCVGCPVGGEAPAQAGSRVQLLGKNKRDLIVWSYGIRTGLDTYHFQFYRNVSKETMLTSTLIQSEKMAALGRLVGAVAHEINNPLAGILATSQILLSDPNGLDPSLKEDIEEIRSAAMRSKKIIDDLLGFTSYDGKNLAENADLAEVIRSTLTFAKSAVKGVEVRVEADDPGPSAWVQVGALQQILFNLITNALHAMNGQGQLRLRVEAEGDERRILVEDSGPGIPPERLKHIFDPFHTSKQEGSGTGLGLSIVRNLTQKIGARVEVHSTLGKGTTFTIYLPAGAQP